MNNAFTDMCVREYPRVVQTLTENLNRLRAANVALATIEWVLRNAPENEQLSKIETILNGFKEGNENYAEVADALATVCEGGEHG